MVLLKNRGLPRRGFGAGNHPLRLPILLAVYLLSGSLWVLEPINGGVQDKDPPGKTIHVRAERFSFTPARIHVPVETRLELILQSEDTIHGFRIAALDVDERVPARGETRIVLELNRKGRFTFECSRPCGAGHNMMRGTLIVE